VSEADGYYPNYYATEAKMTPSKAPSDADAKLIDEAKAWATDDILPLDAKVLLTKLANRLEAATRGPSLDAFDFEFPQSPIAEPDTKAGFFLAGYNQAVTNVRSWLKQKQEGV
jgi:hypothetical protein